MTTLDCSVDVMTAMNILSDVDLYWVRNPAVKLEFTSETFWTKIIVSCVRKNIFRQSINSLKR